MFDGTPPLNPTGPPQLIPDRSIRKAGQYTIDLSDAIIPEGGSGGIDLLVREPNNIATDTVTFLLKFEEVHSYNVSYNWVVS